MLDNYKEFLDQVFADIAQVGIDVSHFELDHIAYTTSSKTEYEELRSKVLKLGELVGEDLVGNRRVGVIKLNQPLLYENRLIPGFELIEPVDGVSTESRLDHIEFVVPQGNNELIKQYPEVSWNTSSMTRLEYPHLKVNGLKVKFHELSIFDTIEHQNYRREQVRG
jgi:predicted metalloenzyme YecM